MATSKQRFKKIADDVQEAAGKASAKVERAIDKAQETASGIAKDAREAGRDLDDQLDAWADENANSLSDRLGTDPHETSGWLKVLVWTLAAAVVFGVLSLMLS